jgi:hypothetical protein
MYLQIIKRHLIRRSLLVIFFLCFSCTLALLHSNSAFASGAGFTVNPSSGYVKVGQDFTVDLLIDSNGDNVTLARAVLTMDPTMVEIIKAEKNAAIFCNWPDDEQTIDNINGVIMVTAFCQSGAGTLYKTDGEPDVFARLTFRPLKPGSIDFEWEWTGEDQAFKSVIMQDGSPPQNLLTPKPRNFKFISTKVNDGNDNGTPNTGNFSKESLVVGGIVLLSSCLIFVGSYIILVASKKRINKNYKTLVIYDDEL